MMKWYEYVVFLCLTNILFCLCNESQSKLFGGLGPFEAVEEVTEYPVPEDFFKVYVENNKPLKMSGAAKRSPAFRLWTDTYFMSRSELENQYVSVEEEKVENRKNPSLNLTFHEFLRIYNESNNYMVNSVPPSLLQDVYLPSPLQCPHIYKNLLFENVMWMSSGDTSSVVHTDSVENIICLLRGTKRFMLVDPVKYPNHVLMDHPEEGYSDIDVNRVDYNKYYGLLSVEYQEVNLTSGDCLYIPYKWIHQVTSTGSNIAVNVWWHHTTSPSDLSSCRHHSNPHATLSDAVFGGPRGGMTDKTQLDFRSELVDLIGEQEGSITLKEFYEMFLMEGELIEDMSKAEANHLKKMFLLSDSNHDGIVEKTEVKNLREKEWKAIEGSYKLFESEESQRSQQIHAGMHKDEL